MPDDKHHKPPKSDGLRPAVAVPDDLREEDILFGQLLVRKGFCTQTQIKEALDSQAQARKVSPETALRLGDILLRKGDIGLAQVEEIVKLRDQIVRLTCPKCGATYRLIEADPKKKYVCKRARAGSVCGAVLRLPGTTSSAVGSHPSFSLRPMPVEVREAAADPRRVFGKYVILKEIGRGGMGAVCQAWDTALGRMVALKFLIGESGGPAPDGEESEEVKRFLREAQTAAAISHPNICQIYDLCMEADRHCIAMQFIEGKHLGGSRLPARRAAEIMHTIALALDHAHEQGIIHRDVKPQNIMLDPRGKPYIMDFGLAKTVKGKSTLTQSGTTIGTPSYMSPEQALGKTRDIDRRTDVYSLGATFYELLTGRPPFVGKNPFDVMTRVVHEEPPLPTQFARGIPPEIEIICQKAMEKDRERRYPSCRAMADDLSRFLAGEQIMARRISVSARLGRKIRKNRAVVIPVAVAAALVIVALVVWGITSARTEREYTDARRRAEQSFEARRYDEALALYAKAHQLRPEDRESAQRVEECRAKLDEERLAAERLRKDEEEKRRKAEDDVRKLEAAAEDARQKRRDAEPFYAKGKQDLDDSMKDFYRPGADLVQTRARLQSAVDSLSTAISLCDTHHEALVERGRAHVLRFEYDEAERDFERAIAVTPDYLSAYVERGRLCVQRHTEILFDLKWVFTKDVTPRLDALRKKAAADFQTAAKLGAEHQRPVFRAFLAFCENNLAECVRQCDEALKANPSQEEVCKLRADAVKFDKGRPQQNGQMTARQKAASLEAIEFYTKALSLRVNFYEALLMRGNEYYESGNSEAAKADFDMALKLRPGDSLGCWFLGTYYMMKAVGGEAGAAETALEWHEKGLKSKPDSFINLLGRSTVRAIQADFAHAIEDINQAIALYPGHAHGWCVHGMYLNMQGQNREALESLEKAVRLDPRMSDAWYTMGIVLWSLRRREEALNAFQKALDLGHGKRADIERRMAKLRAELGR